MAGSRGASADLIHLGDGITETDKPDASALREAWRRLHRTEPPAALSPDFLRRDIAYRQQMECLGGLSLRTRQRLAALANGGPAQSLPRTPAQRIKPGSTLLREWRGRTYTVLALEDGFEMAGQRFSSLSEIAHHITGAHWSGPRFFGLRRTGASPAKRTALNSADDA
jgi:Protein of unknown function (DUF2924)